MSADATGSLILTKRQHPRCAERLLECFLFVLLFRSQGAFSRGENEFIIKKCAVLLWRKWIYYKKVRGAALAEVDLLKKCTVLLWQK